MEWGKKKKKVSGCPFGWSHEMKQVFLTQYFNCFLKLGFSLGLAGFDFVLSKYQRLSAANGKVVDMISEQWSRHRADTKPLKGKGYWLAELKNLFLHTALQFFRFTLVCYEFLRAGGS